MIPIVGLKAGEGRGNILCSALGNPIICVRTVLGTGCGYENGYNMIWKLNILIQKHRTLGKV